VTKCSIIIPVYNHAALTRQCLETLLAAPPCSCGWEIIVVDDGSSDATPALLKGFGDRIRAITQPRNAGFATACNTGAAAATGDHLVFLNNDTVPLSGWLDALVNHARAHPRAGVVGSKLLYPNGTIQHAGIVVMQDRYPRHIYLGFPGNHPAVNKSRRFRMVTGACTLLPRCVFDELGGFDTIFRNGYEDTDLCLRASERGYEIHYCHESVLIHLESVSEGRHGHSSHNTRVFCERWGAVLTPDECQYYVEDGLLQFTYLRSGLLKLAVSPLLAVIDDKSHERTVEKLLCQRAHQVHELLKENILLRLAAASSQVAAGPSTRAA